MHRFGVTLAGSLTPMARAEVIIAGSEASDERVEIATAWGEIRALLNRLSGTRLAMTAR